MKRKKKKFAIILSSVCLGVILLGGIGGKIYMAEKVKIEMQQEQLKRNLAETKNEIIELLEWNYNNVHSVTFDYDNSGGSGVIKVPFDKSLTTTPAGGIFINGYVNGNEQIGLGAMLDSDTLKIAGNYGGYPMLGGDGKKMYKNPTPVTQGSFQSPENYYLIPADISKLKKQGYTKDITFEQIKHYFEEKNR